MALTELKVRNTKPTDKPVKMTDGKGIWSEWRLVLFL